ncbi:TnpV protein [[Clostridium] symbiosum]|uniref:TnpV protein n=1 Tax=Clostridium symbiosum TaxID=1512 RepID=UPI001FB60682|nr:TnpV protein [[Clostridium] symbiosum]
MLRGKSGQKKGANTMVELEYRKGKDGLLYPMLETGTSSEEEMQSLGRYAKRAQEYLLETDRSRYSLLLRTGKLPGILRQVEEEAWELHDQIVENYVKKQMAVQKVNPENTMEMTRLRNEADLIARETVMSEVICKTR